MKVAVGSDHAGYSHKEAVKQLLSQEGHEALDFGTFSPEQVDYPRFVRPAAQAVADGKADRAIVFGGSGNGEAIVANKVRGVRCALCWSVEAARLARGHNDANVLSLGERLVPVELALEIVRTWLVTPFDGGRHARRIAQIEPPRPSAQELIRLLELRPLELEGGFYRETYRSPDRLPASAFCPGRYSQEKSCGTSIYYLLTPQTHSRLHRLPTDEIFHFYSGDPVEMLQLRPDGRSELVVLGSDVTAGQRPQAVVPMLTWQGSRLMSGGQYALLGVTVSPGFDPGDYQPADAAALAKQYPDRAELIRSLA